MALRKFRFGARKFRYGADKNYVKEAYKSERNAMLFSENAYLQWRYCLFKSFESPSSTRLGDLKIRCGAKDFRCGTESS